MDQGRRDALGGLLWAGAAFATPAFVHAQTRQQTPLVPVQKANGYTNGEWFEWTSIGVDSFGAQPVAIALALMGIPEDLRPAIIERVEIEPGKRREPDRVIRIGHQAKFDAMVSGGGKGAISKSAWVTPSVRAWPLPWKAADRRADVYGFSDLGLDFWCPHRCGNWSLIDYGKTTFWQCREDPESGDVVKVRL